RVASDLFPAADAKEERPGPAANLKADHGGRERMSWRFEPVGGPVGFAEGPAWDGSGLLFTDIANSRVMRHDPVTGETAVYREGTNEANGLMLDPEGRLYACEGGGRRVVRYEPDGITTVLADRFEGRRLNSPNDLAIDARGRVWFTDPRY